MWLYGARLTIGVAQPATVGRSGPPHESGASRTVRAAPTSVRLPRGYVPLVLSLLPPAVGVGHGDKEEALPDVRRTDARRCKIGGPDGIARCFQVSAYSGEPRESIRARNLLSKED